MIRTYGVACDGDDQRVMATPHRSPYGIAIVVRCCKAKDRGVSDGDGRRGVSDAPMIQDHASRCHQHHIVPFGGNSYEVLHASDASVRVGGIEKS